MPGTKFFSRMNYQVKRGLGEILTEDKLSKDDWEIIKKFFNFKCAFCESKDTENPRTGLVQDHLIPASKLGDRVIGNIVPACHDCNDKRGDKDWKPWISKNFINSQKRILLIEKYILIYNYVVPHIKSRVSSSNYKKYKNILKSWDELWKTAKQLRDKVKTERKIY